MQQNNPPKLNYDHRYNLRIIFFATCVLAGTTARADVLHVGGFTGTSNVERVENVAPHTAPVWKEGAGSYIEIVSTLEQTDNGEASVLFRMPGSDAPLAWVWQSGVPGAQLIAPGGLPVNTETQTPGVPKTLTLRVRIRSLNTPVQRLILETQQPDGGWLKVMEKNWTLTRVREWVEEDLGVLRIGVVGPVEIKNTHVRVMRDGTL